MGMANQLVQTGIGSTDWAGGVAPSGGVHTGQCILTMIDGTTFTVAHSANEAKKKINSAPSVPAGFTQWVAWDIPLRAVPIILNIANVQSVR